MSEIQFDMARLAAIDGLNTESAVSYFSCYSAYFRELTAFERDAHVYLRAYTPSFVIYSDDMREEFLREVRELQHKFIALGMLHTASMLTDLTHAVHACDVPSLTDGLTVFYAGMNIMAEHIRSAREESQ
ncbi:MAG: hypothetical protein FWH06_05135 [Oscillospiraceae bacterium]|nr:hypothetical protein [Oscillospiraceae bacterium]